MTSTRPAIARAVRHLGSDINRARRARRMSTADFAARMGVGRSTLARLEKGKPGVSIGALAAAMAALGELHRLSELIDPGSDDAALLLAGRTLPKRIRSPAKPAPAGQEPIGGEVTDDGVAF